MPSTGGHLPSTLRAINSGRLLGCVSALLVGCPSVTSKPLWGGRTQSVRGVPVSISPGKKQQSLNRMLWFIVSCVPRCCWGNAGSWEREGGGPWSELPLRGSTNQARRGLLRYGQNLVWFQVVEEREREGLLQEIQAWLFTMKSYPPLRSLLIQIF